MLVCVLVSYLIPQSHSREINRWLVIVISPTQAPHLIFPLAACLLACCTVLLTLPLFNVAIVHAYTTNPTFLFVL